VHLLEVGVQWPPETFLRRKLEGLAARGVRVTVASSLIHDDQVVLRGVELLRMPGSGSGALVAWRAALGLAIRSPRRLVRLVRNVRRVPPALGRRHGGSRGLLVMCLPLARIRPDVVQFEWNIAAVDHLPLFEIWGCPVVTSCRGSDLTVYPHIPALRPYAERLPEVMSRASAVHCVSESLRKEAADFGLDPSKAHVIRPAVDPEVFRPAVDEEGRTLREHGRVLRVLSVADARWEKGHEYALQAIRRLLDDGVPVQLEVIGGAPDEPVGALPEQQRILHTVTDLALSERVKLRGRMTSVQVSRCLARADVLLHSSLAEGIPNAVLEAMACGVPVVTTNCGGVCEAVSEGVEGYVVDARAPDQLAGALGRLWRDPQLRERMGDAGRRRVQSSFTLAAQVQQFLMLYQKLVS
jgi:glycosyltransferase involved in cell wall biosynthesis